MTNEQIFTPNPDEIKTVAVVDLHGRTQTYSSLLSAMTAVYGLPQAAHRRIEAILKTAPATGSGQAVSEEVGDE